MNDIAQRPDADPAHDFDAGHPGGRLAAYQARTEVPLDLLALVMLWFVLVPPWHYDQDVRGIWWALRIALSVVYGIDLAIRSVLSEHPGRYVRSPAPAWSGPCSGAGTCRVSCWPQRCWSSTARSSCTCTSGTRPTPAS